MITITATNARSNLFQIVKKTAKGHLPTRISSKEGNVVVISEDSYESLLETAELLSEPGLKESIKKADKEIEKGEVYTFAETFKD
ncbi:type II toxin-antitoxin system Phd/YefM family antitoxin [Candidatus Peregrinibacteria bacterium]|nr:type II toxin-antitoxin system Phd/YefM family antitoxin [Candidatus Peregrinibacteria bacterium]